ncbi:MAG: transcriptional repressor [Chloroflexi bacterium]|nr:transcriptional repressor [Chloroflexota bacterium]
MAPNSTADSNPDSLSAQLAARGYKLTRPRRAVLRVVAETRESLSPAQIHSRARKFHPQTGLVTVYRTLEVLAECGAVRKVHQADGCHSYAPASEGHAHHIICENCHSVVEFEDCDLAEMVKTVQRHTGYKIEGHWLELFGVCPNCRR